MNNLITTKHLKQRMNQRGITDKMKNFILKYGEERRAKGNAICIVLSKKLASNLLHSKKLTSLELAYLKANIERLIKKAIILYEDMIVTAYNITKKRYSY